MTELPSGAVTFLFSDIEGSTRLVKALRERYVQVLAEHRRLVRAAIADAGIAVTNIAGIVPYALGAPAEDVIEGLGLPDVRVAATGASQSGVMRVGAIEQALKSNWSAGALDNVKISPDGLLADIHGSAAYRANLIKVMAQRAVTAAG